MAHERLHYIIILVEVGSSFFELSAQKAPQGAFFYKMNIDLAG